MAEDSRLGSVAFGLVCVLGVVACSSESKTQVVVADSGAGTGGSAGAGASGGSGGTSAGGTGASGGSGGSGGISAAGGASGTGGSSGAAGNGGTGGTAGADAGPDASAGAGGVAGTAGTNATGGTGGAGGSSGIDGAAGNGGTGGVAGADAGPDTSAGTGGVAGTAGTNATGGTGGAGGSSGIDGAAGNTGTGGTAGMGGGDGSADGASGVRKRVFVTSARYNGNLQAAGAAASGIQGADNLCNQHGAALGGVWRAWISAGQGAYDRIQTNGPWYRVDRVTLVFPDRSSLTGFPRVPIATDENGFTYTSNTHVWTGTDVGGTPATTGQRCNGWTGGIGSFGQYGNMNSAGAAWTNAGAELCPSSENRLICFEL